MKTLGHATPTSLLRRIGVVLMLVPLFWQPGRAQPSLGGYFKLFYHVNTNAPYPYDRLGSRLQLVLTQTLGRRAALFTAVNFNFEETAVTGLAQESRARGMEIYPVESYIDLYFPFFDLRLGKQFIFWGKADWINPTDNINPWDYQNIAAEIEDYRIPVMAARFTLYLGGWSLEGVLIPRFQPNKIPIEVPKTMGPYPVEKLPAALPENRLANAEWAMKLSSQWLGIDYSISYFQGFHKFPDIRIQPRLNAYHVPEAILWQEQYNPIQIIGGDFVVTQGRWVIKGEGAYFRTRDRQGRNVFLENPFIQYILGFDYRFSDDLSLTLQCSQLRRMKYDPDRERLMWRQLGNPAPRIPEPLESSLSTRLVYQILPYTSLQLIGVMNAKHRDLFILPILYHELADGLNVYGGVTLFRGPEDSPFGQNQKYSRAFLEIKYSF